jgi:predicted DNA-binding transcriptional regulator AlpA
MQKKERVRVNNEQETRRKEIAPRLLGIDQTAVYLGIAAKTIRNRIGLKAKNPFPVKPKRIGGRVLFDKKELDLFIDSLTTGNN